MTAQESTGARLARLLKADIAGDPTPPALNWEHEVGSTLEGTFLRWVTRPGRFEKSEQAALIEDASGRQYAVGRSLTMLRFEFDKTNPQPGNRITIKRGADRDVGKPNLLKTFKITVDRSTGSPPRADWNLEGSRR